MGLHDISPGPLLVEIFDQELTADAASIDTGANGIEQISNHLMIVILARTALAATLDNILVTANGDATAANYFTQFSNSHGSTVGGFQDIGTLAGIAVQVPGATATAGLYSAAQILIPRYGGTIATKVFNYTNIVAAALTSGNVQAQNGGGYWNNTAAINRLTFTGAGGNLKAGSRVTIYGMP